MATTDAEILELCRISLTNSGSQSAIVEIMDNSAMAQKDWRKAGHRRLHNCNLP